MLPCEAWSLSLSLSLSIYLTQKQSYEIYTIIYCVQAFSEIFQDIKMVKSMAFGAKLYSKSASSIFWKYTLLLLPSEGTF